MTYSFPKLNNILPPFQKNIRYFGIFIYITFAMHLDIHCIYIHSKNHEFRNVKTNLQCRKKGSIYVVVTNDRSF
jgi:hypothetical protein